MVRMSDILKKAKGIKYEEAKAPQGAEKPAPQPPLPEPRKKNTPTKSKSTVFKEAITRKEKATVSVSSIVMKEGKVASGDESMKLYEEAVTLMEELLANLDPNAIDVKKTAAVVEKIVNQSILNNKRLIMLIFNGQPSC